jgi:hypothetical protein
LRLFPRQSAAPILAPINGAPATGNIPQEHEGASATLVSAEALVSLPLLWGRQKQNCLYFIHKMIFL